MHYVFVRNSLPVRTLRAPTLPSCVLPASSLRGVVSPCEKAALRRVVGNGMIMRSSPMLLEQNRRNAYLPKQVGTL